MHEHTIAEKIIGQANEYGNIKSVLIEVGDLAHLPADDMKRVLEEKTDWIVNTITKPAVVACDCGHIGEPHIIQHLHDNTIYECPHCHTKLPKILEGHDITLKEAEIFEDEEEEEEDDYYTDNDSDDDEYENDGNDDDDDEDVIDDDSDDEEEREDE